MFLSFSTLHKLTVESPTFWEACWKYLVLGIIQGLTEFLPISSTAHLKALPILFNWGDPGLSTTAVIQLGSIFAVLGYFRNDLKSILKGISLAFRESQWRDKNARLGIAISIGTLPILTGGMAIKLFWDDFEISPIRTMPAIAIISIVMALLMALAEKMGKRQKCLQGIQGKDGLLIGMSQMLALIPGVSRSGITLTTSLLSGWEREDAAKFSFLLGIPAISISGLVELQDAFEYNAFNITGVFPLLIGILSATIFSWLTIDWLLKYLKKQSTWIFISYRLIFGIGILWWYSVIGSN